MYTMFKSYKKERKGAKKKRVCFIFMVKFLGEAVLPTMTSVLVIPHKGKLETTLAFEACQRRPF